MKFRIKVVLIGLFFGIAGTGHGAPASNAAQLEALLQQTFGGSQRLLSGVIVPDDSTDDPLPNDPYNGRVLKPCKKADPDECVIRIRASPWTASGCTVDVSSLVVIAHDATRRIHWRLRGDRGVVRFKPNPIRYLVDAAHGVPGFDPPVRDSERRASAMPNASTDSAVAYEINVQRNVPGLGWKDCIPSDPIIVNQS